METAHILYKNKKEIIKSP